MKSNSCVVFFDGVCNLCNTSVDFLIRVDKKRKLKYASLQSDFAKKSLNIPPERLHDSVVFFRNDKTFVKAEAALKILKELGGFYRFLGVLFSIFPYWFLNIFYNLIAKNRYRFFGKKETCRVPSDEEKELFIE